MLYSISRFHEVTGQYPAGITIVGFGYKRMRFEQVHRVALRWPADRFEYIGIDSDGEDGASLAGERTYGIGPWAQDVQGCHRELLAKRRGRNPHNRVPGYHVSNPALVPLFEHCPDDSTAHFKGHLPWRTG